MMKFQIWIQQGYIELFQYGLLTEQDAYSDKCKFFLSSTYNNIKDYKWSSINHDSAFNYNSSVYRTDINGSNPPMFDSTNLTMFNHI